MSKPNQHLSNISAMSFAIGADGVTSEAHLLPAGEFVPTDGRDLPVKAFKIDATIANKVIARMSARKNDTLIDYEHQSLYATENGKPVIAAGWFHDMEFRADGLWATNVGWTETAKKHIKEKEYRYISAVFAYDKTTGAVIDVLSIALTNTPALDGLQSLAALTKLLQNNPHPNPPPQGEGDLSIGDLAMPDPNQDLAALTTERNNLQTNVTALTAERDTLKTQVTALTTERDSLKTKVDAAEAEKTAVALATEKKAHSDLLTTALSDGRLAPAQKAWAEKQNLAALTEYLDATKPLVAGGRQADTASQDANHGLSETELAMCSRMNVKPEEFAKSKTEEAAQKTQAKA